MIRARRAMGILLLLTSLVILLWGIWPPFTVVRTFPIMIALEALPTSDRVSVSSISMSSPIENIATTMVYPSILLTPPPPVPVGPINTSIPSGMPENRLLVLEWPAKLRVGDASYLRLKLDVDQQGDPSPTTDVANFEPGNETYKNPKSPAFRNIIMEAKLDMAGMQYTPSGEISESLHPGQPAMFLWSVRAPKVGTYRGAIWLHARFIPLAEGGEIRSVLSAPRVEIEAINFLGLGGTAARVLGSVGVVVGSILGLDGLLSWFWSFFINLRKPGSHIVR